MIRLADQDRSTTLPAVPGRRAGGRSDRAANMSESRSPPPPSRATLDSMTSQVQSPKSIVLDAWAAFKEGDPVRVGSVFSDRAEWIAPFDNATARAMNDIHHFVGRESIVRFITSWFPRVFVSDVAVEFTGLHECGNTVIVEETMTATLFHGGHYVNQYCFVFEVDGERISRVREYVDTQRGHFWFSTPRRPTGDPIHDRAARDSDQGLNHALG